MRYNISDKMKDLKPSAIREIIKYTADPSVISLAAGDPAPESLPIEQIAALLANLFADGKADKLLYSQSEGYPPLRELVCSLVNNHYKIRASKENIIITSGAQQAIDLFTKVVCNEGDTIICESPSFIGALNTFRSYNANLVGVDMQPDGMDIDQLEQALKTNKNVRFIYVIPNFNNPTGITTSLEKRKAIYALALKYDVLILEDNPYGDLRFSGEAITSIKSFDTEDIVFYAGTFSKVISSGMRLGYLVSPAPLMPALTVAKQSTDVHSSMLSQALCQSFLTEFSFDDHLANLIVIYKEKSSAMLNSIDKYFPKEVSYIRPEGGLFVWCTLPNGIDSTELAQRAVKEKKVCIVPGNTFLVDSSEPSGSFRLNFSKVSLDDIPTAIAKLGELIKEYV